MVNDKGELLDFMITQANVDYRALLKQNNLLKKIWGKLYADKGYIFKELSVLLFDQGLHLISGIKNNMKNVMMTLKDKIGLRKRSVIEALNDQLKNIVQAKHSRYRSFGNFNTNLAASLLAYSFHEMKANMKFKSDNSNHLALFLLNCGWSEIDGFHN